MSNVKEISVFVDESGSFVPLNEDPATPYYILSMVFHNQSSDISADLLRLEASLHAMGLERNHCVHAGPLIRREYGYSAVEFVPDVDPACYRLFQAADLACTIELVNMKLEKTGTMSASEKAFFGGEKVFRKSYLKPILRKRIE